MMSEKRKKGEKEVQSIKMKGRLPRKEEMKQLLSIKAIFFTYSALFQGYTLAL